MIYWVQRAIDIVRATERSSKALFRYDAAVAEIRLTPREREAMSWAAQGKTVQDTAEILHLSSETVDSYINQALAKLGALNKTHGVAKCIALGIIDL